MGTCLHHLPGVQYDDPVCSPRCLQAMRDHHGGPTVRHLLHRRGDVGLGHQVEIGRRLVEEQDHGIDELSPSQRDQLALP